MTHIIQASFYFPPQIRETVESVFLDFGITCYMDGDGELEIRSDVLTCYLPTTEEVAKLEQFVREELKHCGLDNKLSVKTLSIRNEDWQTAWQKDWKPTLAGNSFCICPSWLNYDGNDKQIINIDPQMAFGTGTHETTRLCLELIETVFEARQINSVLDVGCGTGILSIATAMLGASKVCGIDIEEHILETARGNVAQNSAKLGNSSINFSNKLLQDIDSKFDLICANILSSIIKELWTYIQAKLATNGIIILSGILAEEQEEFIKTLGIKPAKVITKGDWIAIMIA